MRLRHAHVDAQRCARRCACCASVFRGLRPICVPWHMSKCRIPRSLHVLMLSAALKEKLLAPAEIRRLLSQKRDAPRVVSVLSANASDPQPRAAPPPFLSSKWPLPDDEATDSAATRSECAAPAADGADGDGDALTYRAPGKPGLVLVIPPPEALPAALLKCCIFGEQRFLHVHVPAGPSGAATPFQVWAATPAACATRQLARRGSSHRGCERLLVRA